MCIPQLFPSTTIKAIAFILCFSLSIATTAQSSLDSMLTLQFETRDTNLFHHYTNLIIELFYSDLNLAKEYVDKQMTLADELDDPELSAFASNIHAVYYSNISEYAKSKELFEDVLEQYKAMGNMERVSALLNNIAICNQNLGNLDLALENQMRSLRIKDSLGVAPAAIAASFWNISNIFWEIGDIPQSNDYIYKAMNIYAEIGDKKSVIQLKDLLSSNLLEDQDSIDKAEQFMMECMAFYKENSQLNNLAGIYEGLGTIAIQEERINDAKDWYTKALDIAEKEGEKRFPGILYRRLANVYKKQGNFSKALAYAQKALQSAQDLKLRKKEINDHLELADIYEEMGRYDDALASFQTFHMLNDSILGNEKVLAITELEKKYQTEKKEQQIILLEEQKKSAKLRQLALILALSSLIILLIGLWTYYTQKSKRNKIEKEKLDQEIAFKNRDLASKKQELTVFALQLAQKNELLENLKVDIQQINNNATHNKSLQSLINTIQFNQNDEEAWNSFKTRFEQIHVGFNKRVLETYPAVTTNDLRIIALIKMNLSSKEIANILNISASGIKKARYRLRKKLALENESNLDHFIVSL